MSCETHATFGEMRTLSWSYHLTHAVCCAQFEQKYSTLRCFLIFIHSKGRFSWCEHQCKSSFHSPVKFSPSSDTPDTSLTEQLTSLWGQLPTQYLPVPNAYERHPIHCQFFFVDIIAQVINFPLKISHLYVHCSQRAESTAGNLCSYLILSYITSYSEHHEGFNITNRKYGDWNNLCSRTDGSYYELSELTHIVLTSECNSKASFSK